MWERITIITRRVKHGNALQAQLHVLITLAVSVSIRQVCLVVTIGSRDDAGRRVVAAVLVLVPAGLGVRIYAVGIRIIAAVIGTVRPINRVEEVVEGRALLIISNLEEGDLLRVRERHGILQVEVGLAVEGEDLDEVLRASSVNRVERWPVADLVRGEVGKEQVKVVWEVGLVAILHDTVAASVQCSGGEVVQGTKAVGGDLRITVREVSTDGMDIDLLAGLWQRSSVVGSQCCKTGLVTLLPLLEPSIKLDRREDHVDVVCAQIRRYAVLITCDVRLTILVPEDVVFRLQEILNLSNGGVADFYPTLVGMLVDPLRGKARICEPRGNLIGTLITSEYQ